MRVSFSVMETGRTKDGLMYEKYGSDSEKPIVIFAGLNVKPNTGYFCDFPRDAAECFGEAIVVYQEGVSGSLLRTGFFSPGTERRQLNAALELVKGKRFVPVTHSITSILGTKLLDPIFRRENHAGDALPGVISSMYTSVDDVLFDRDVRRRILGIDALLLFKVGRYLPIPVPFYPLRDGAAHSRFGVVDASEIASKWVNTRSADYCFRSEGLVGSVKPDQKAIGIVTLQDRITSAEKQADLYGQLNAEIIPVDSGHRWMADEESCHTVLCAIAKQLKNC